MAMARPQCLIIVLWKPDDNPAKADVISRLPISRESYSRNETTSPIFMIGQFARGTCIS